MAIASIRETVYTDDLFSDTDGADVEASAERYANLLQAALGSAFRGTRIWITVQPGSSGAGSAGDLVISQESDSTPYFGVADEAEQAAALERVQDIATDLWECGDWIVPSVDASVLA